MCRNGFIVSCLNWSNCILSTPANLVSIQQYFLSIRVKVMECSAKDNYNITELFKTLLSLSKLIPLEHPIETNGGPLKRRSSAYVSATSKGMLNVLLVVWKQGSNRILLRPKSHAKPICRKWKVVLIHVVFEQQRQWGIWFGNKIKTKVEVGEKKWSHLNSFPYTFPFMNPHHHQPSPPHMTLIFFVVFV